MLWIVLETRAREKLYSKTLKPHHLVLIFQNIMKLNLWKVLVILSKNNNVICTFAWHCCWLKQEHVYARADWKWGRAHESNHHHVHNWVLRLLVFSASLKFNSREPTYCSNTGNNTVSDLFAVYVCMLNVLSIRCSKFVSAPQINFAEVLEASWTVILKALEQALY